MRNHLHSLHRLKSWRCRNWTNPNSWSLLLLVISAFISALFTKCQAASVRAADNNANQSFRLTLSSKVWTSPNAEMSWVKYPYQVNIGSRIYAQIEMTKPANDEDLKAYAKECFFSKNSDPTLDPKFKIITSGCAVGKSVLLHHFNDSPMIRYSRFSFVVEKVYFDSNYMYFQCKVVACSLQGGREHEGYETCPNRTMCSDRTIDSHYVPMESKHSYVSSGLMRPIMAESSQSQQSKNVHVGNGNCTCPTSKPVAPEPQQDVIHNDHGVSVATAAVIGICSFAVGILCVGAVWYIHDHSEPKKYWNVHGKRRNSDRDSSSYVSAPTPNACTPMTKNGFVVNDAKGALPLPSMA